MAARFRLLAVFLALFGISTAAPARAETITVTSGHATVAWDDPSWFQLFADGLVLGGIFTPVAASPQNICFSGCLAGTSVDMSAVFGSAVTGSLGYTNTAFVGGVVYGDPTNLMPVLDLFGTLEFDAPSVVLPPISGLEPGAVHLTAPFMFRGHVTGFAAGNHDVPLFEVDLDGSGTARLGLSVLPGDDRYRFPEATYAFDAADPIPEPTTLVLFGSGVAGLFMRRRARA